MACQGYCLDKPRQYLLNGCSSTLRNRNHYNQTIIVKSVLGRAAIKRAAFPETDISADCIDYNKHLEHRLHRLHWSTVPLPLLYLNPQTIHPPPSPSAHTLGRMHTFCVCRFHSASESAHRIGQKMHCGS